MTAREAARLHATVHGLVQGVNFRYYTTRQAAQLGVAGWVRNRADGTVEVVAEGPKRDLDALLGWLQQGPGSAEVDHVDAEWGAATGEFRGFRVHY